MSSQNLQKNRPRYLGWSRRLTFAGANVVQVQLVALLGSLQGALGGKELAGGLVGLVVSAADLQEGRRDQLKLFIQKFLDLISYLLSRDSHARTVPQRQGSWWGPGTHRWACCFRPPRTPCPSCSGGSGKGLQKNKSTARRKRVAEVKAQTQSHWRQCKTDVEKKKN